MLNMLWLGFFVIAAGSAMWRWLVAGDAAVFAAMVDSLFAMAKLSVDVMILLFGTLTLWLGFLRIAENAGLVEALARRLSPLFTRLMPEVPPGHPALGLITMNFTANALGLDNAATPIGLKAMRELQSLNPSPEVASNAQILFLVLNASSLTLLPVSIFMYRAQQGAADPTLVFLPILLATTASTLAGFFSVAFVQRLRLRDPVVMGSLLASALALGSFIAVLSGLSSAALAALSSLLGNAVLFGLILLFVLAGAWRRVPVYEAFVEGAREGFDVAKNLLPYLVAMLCAVGVLRAPQAVVLVPLGLVLGVAVRAGRDTGAHRVRRLVEHAFGGLLVTARRGGEPAGELLRHDVPDDPRRGWRGKKRYDGASRDRWRRTGFRTARTPSRRPPPSRRASRRPTRSRR